MNASLTRRHIHPALLSALCALSTRSPIVQRLTSIVLTQPWYFLKLSAAGFHLQTTAIDHDQLVRLGRRS